MTSKFDRTDRAIEAFYGAVRDVFPDATDDQVADILGGLTKRHFLVRRWGPVGLAPLVWSAIRDTRRSRRVRP